MSIKDGDLTQKQQDVFNFLANQFYQEGKVTNIGFTGRAGAGKSTFADNFSQYCVEKGISVIQYQGDWDFKLSSSERKKWINEPLERGDLEGYAARAHQESWWDFDQMKENLQNLRDGNPVKLRNAYDKETGGKTLDHDIDQPTDGLVVFENCFVGQVLGALDKLVYIHADLEQAFNRTRQRDSHRKGFGDSIQRLHETTRSEDLHRARYLDQMTNQGLLVVDNNDFENPVIADTSIIPNGVPYDKLVVPVKYLGQQEPQELRAVGE